MTSPEAQRIEQLLRNVLSDADRRSWESLITRFVDDVVLDYGSPERLTPGQIVSRWPRCCRPSTRPSTCCATLGLDAVAIAPDVKVPTLLVHGEKAAIPDGAKRFFAGLRAPKELVWTDAASQFHFYDDPASIAPAIPAGLRHLAVR